MSLYDSMIANIAGSEWIIIVLLALILIFGTKRLPQLSRSIGKAVGEYEKARQTFRNEMQEATEQARKEAGISKNVPVSGPVATEREKLEVIAKSLGIDHLGKTDEELRSMISQKMNA